MSAADRERWRQLWHGVAARDDADARYDRLLSFYAQPHRRYHNLQHITECLAEFDAAQHLAHHRAAVELAVWFHDAVYDPRATDNEERSAELAGHWLSEAGATSAAEAKNAKREAVTWGKRAAWCDYYGPVDGKTVGVAIFDHPANPRHPTWWHVRDYGLFAANPFGKHFFENLPDVNAGNLTIPRGQSVTFRYRFYFHEGDTTQSKVAERYQEYVSQ